MTYAVNTYSISYQDLIFKSTRLFIYSCGFLSERFHTNNQFNSILQIPIPGWDHRLEIRTHLENLRQQIVTVWLLEMHSEAFCLNNVPWVCQWWKTEKISRRKLQKENSTLNFPALSPLRFLNSRNKGFESGQKVEATFPGHWNSPKMGIKRSITEL